MAINIISVNGYGGGKFNGMNGFASASVSDINFLKAGGPPKGPAIPVDNEWSIDIGNSNGTATYTFVEVQDPALYNFTSSTGFNNGTATAVGGDSPFSVSMWFSASHGPRWLISKGDDGDREWSCAFYYSGGYYRAWFVFEDDAGSTISIFDTTRDWGHLTGSWNHIAFTYGAPSGSADGDWPPEGSANRRDSLAYYVNGTKYTSGRTAYPMWWDGSAYVPRYTGVLTKDDSPLHIGKYPTNQYTFRGLIDEVSVWTKELSEDEVTRIYNHGTASVLTGEDGLLSWWRMGDAVAGDGEEIPNAVTSTTSSGSVWSDANPPTPGWSSPDGFEKDAPP